MRERVTGGIHVVFAPRTPLCRDRSLTAASLVPEPTRQQSAHVRRKLQGACSTTAGRNNWNTGNRQTEEAHELRRCNLLDRLFDRAGRDWPSARRARV